MEERLQKYKARGFTVVDEPPPFLTEPDSRTDEALESWKEVNGFDVFEYEDKEVLEHLQASEWNIVLGVGSVWYVFERKKITEYMKEKRHIDPVWGTMYDTPFRQTIPHDAWDGLFYSDHSIFVLVAPEEHPFRGSTKTLYDVEAYSTLDWIQSVVSHVYDKRTHLRLIAASGQEEVKEDIYEPNPEFDQDELDVIRVIGASLNLSAADFLSDDEDPLGLDLLNAPHEELPVLALPAPALVAPALVAPALVAPVPDIPLSPISHNMSYNESELYQQLMAWIQVDQPYM